MTENKDGPGGYMVALFGTGKKAAGRLGILDRIHNRMSAVPGVEVDRRGRTRPGMAMGGDAAADGPWLLVRGDVEEAAHAEP